MYYLSCSKSISLISHFYIYLMRGLDQYNKNISILQFLHATPTWKMANEWSPWMRRTMPTRSLCCSSRAAMASPVSTTSHRSSREDGFTETAMLEIERMHELFAGRLGEEEGHGFQLLLVLLLRRSRRFE